MYLKFALKADDTEYLQKNIKIRYVSTKIIPTVTSFVEDLSESNDFTSEEKHLKLIDAFPSKQGNESSMRHSCFLTHRAKVGLNFGCVPEDLVTFLEENECKRIKYGTAG